MIARTKGPQALARKDRRLWLIVAAVSAIVIGIPLYALTH